MQCYWAWIASSTKLTYRRMPFWALGAEERDARLAILREKRPVSRQRPAAGMGTMPGSEGTGYWAVLRHADVMTVSRDAETYSSAQTSRPFPIPGGSTSPGNRSTSDLAAGARTSACGPPWP